MPRANRTCKTCPAILEPGSGGQCEPCLRAKRQEHDRARGTSKERGYTGAGHRRFRKAILTRDPVCVLCGKAWATVADHHPLSRKQLVAQGLDPDDPNAGRGLCAPCHDRETAANQPGGWNFRQSSTALPDEGGGDP